MSREIKFRAWSKNDEEYLSQDGIEPYHYTLKGFSDGCIYDLYLYILEQYTGLKDRNGKEVYEGDILKFEDNIFEIGWFNKGARFGFCPIKKCNISMGFSLSRSEVIGNVHENKELLGGKDES